MDRPAEPTGTIDTALAHTERLLKIDPALAPEQAAQILKVVPNHPLAVLLLGSARRWAGDDAGALTVLEPLALAQVKSAAAHYELGLVLGNLGQPEAALAALRHAVALKPDMP